MLSEPLGTWPLEACFARREEKSHHANPCIVMSGTAACQANVKTLAAGGLVPQPTWSEAVALRQTLEKFLGFRVGGVDLKHAP